MCRSADSFLIQQTLVSHAVSIAKLYKGHNATTYQKAADSLRAAYWDWAVNSTLPEVVTVQYVKVNGPGGPLTMTNPFHRYYFQNYPFFINYMDSGVLSLQQHTTRCPNANLVDNVATVDQGLTAYGSLMDQVVRDIAPRVSVCPLIRKGSQKDMQS